MGPDVPRPRFIPNLKTPRRDLLNLHLHPPPSLGGTGGAYRVYEDPADLLLSPR